MAATQAEKQQNDVNSEKVQQEQHHNARNTLLQNGTDKNSVRGIPKGSVVVTKGKNTSAKNLATDMSQYRQDGDGGPEQGINESEIGPNTESGIYPLQQGSGSEGPPPVGDGHGYGFSFAAGGGRDIHNSGEGGLHQSFGPRQPFPGPKQSPGPGNFSQQQRFVSGQTISQPTGPTPTLNQLLQSSNPMHRYHNNYVHPEQPYNQNWSQQKPIASYGPTPSGAPGSSPGPNYRNQPSVGQLHSICFTSKIR